MNIQMMEPMTSHAFGGHSRHLESMTSYQKS